MIERFRDLTTKQKVGAIALAVAFLGFVIFFFSGLVNQNNSEPKPEETTQTNPQNPESTDTPTDVPTDTASPDASPTSTGGPSPSAMPSIEYGQGSLNDEETVEVQSSAITAIEEFIKWNPDESMEERKSRIAPFIAPKSGVIDLAPDLRPASSYANDNGAAQIASAGSTDYITAVGGDESRYRVSIGIVLRTQYNYDENASQKSSVIKNSSNIIVDMTKDNGTWKILEISKS
ncbi:MAG: hypothetical protein H9W81_07285 [Enterococcus sp.]|nr:hypothetical protein [Enterococcus sp.]